MGNKTTFNKQPNFHGSSKPHMSVNTSGGVSKRTYTGVRTSRVGKKAKEMVKKNLAFFLRGIKFQQMIKYDTTNDHSLTASGSNSSFSYFGMHNNYNQNKLAANDIDDEQSHLSISAALAKKYALHASPSWQYVASTVGEPKFPHVDTLPRTWKESLNPDEQNSFSVTAKQVKYQELIYEVVLTEQAYVDDLILVYEIFIKEALCWDGLSSAVRQLFENVFQIIRLHLQLLKELRSRQLSQHPVVNSITDICRSFVSRFDIYSTYFSNFEKANNYITESIRVQDELGSYLSRRSAWNECRNLPFTAYLLTPIQRIMKYPLFFKSLSDCLLEADGDMENMQCFLLEMDIILRFFEKQKKDSEDFIKLENLSSRISGLEGSTIRLAEQGRKLIYEGYLTIIPGAQQQVAARPDSSNVSFSSSVNPPTLSRRNSSFSLTSRKHKPSYVFLFNDLIVCTRERSKKKQSPIDNKAMGPPPRKGSYYGPSSDTLFKITHTPGRITMVDRAVMRQVSYGNGSSRLSRRGSALFQSLRKYGSHHQDDQPHSQSTESLASSFNTPHYSEPQSPTYERHPQQFVCSIATRNLTNIQFEAETPEEKDTWCEHLESVLSQHVQRNNNNSSSSNNSQLDNGSFYQRSLLSPSQSNYSFESISSVESLSFAAAWTGYCDIEKMDVDEDQQLVQLQQQQEKLSLNTPVIMDEKAVDIMSTIMNEFDDSIWSIGAPAGMSPYQLRKTFSDIGADI